MGEPRARAARSEKHEAAPSDAVYLSPSQRATRGHVSKATLAVLAERAHWLTVEWPPEPRSYLATHQTSPNPCVFRELWVARSASLTGEAKFCPTKRRVA
jgi:hypothetical protein